MRPSPPSLPLLLLFLLHLLPCLPCIFTPDLAALEAHLNAGASQTESLLFSLLSIPSVSADPSRASSVHACADWLVTHLKSLPLHNVQQLPSPLHPSVYADWLHAPGKPTLLIYAHYDVQPEHPLHLWHTPPFHPSVRQHRVYARGASDDKGPLISVIAAIAAYLKVHGELPLNIKLLFEGEEEIGSPNIRRILQQNRELLHADFALCSDGSQISSTIPSLTLSVRGSVALEFRVRVADVDMHSGVFGGGVQNPITVIASVLASLRDAASGKVLVHGFYDGVNPISDQIHAYIHNHPISQQQKLASVGVNESVGEGDRSFYERVWFRPSLDIVGITGGHQGDGIKTVLAKQASAKVTARLVSGQDSKKVLQSLKAHIVNQCQSIPGVSVDIEAETSGSNAYMTSAESALNVAATEVLTDMYGRSPVVEFMGGSIPILTVMKEELGIETSLFSFADSDSTIHAPNEFLRLASLHRGALAYVKMLKRVGEIEVGGKGIKGDDDASKEEL